MSMKVKFLWKNLVSCILLVLTCTTFLFSWVTISDKIEVDLNGIEDIKLRELKNEIDKLEDYSDDLEDVFDEYDVDVSVDSLYETTEEVYNFIKDLKLSPKELVDILPVLEESLEEIYSALEEIEKNDEFCEDYYYDLFSNEEPEYIFDDEEGAYVRVESKGSYNVLENLDEIMEGVEVGIDAVKEIYSIFSICILVTLAIDLIYLLLHLYNRKWIGGAIIGGVSITLHTAWAAVFTLVVIFANSEMKTEVLSLTPAPYVGVVMIITSAVFWALAKRDYAKLRTLKTVPVTEPVQPMVTPVAAPVVQPVVTPVVEAPVVQPMVTPVVEAPVVTPVVTPVVETPAVQPVVTPVVEAPKVQPVVTPVVKAPVVEPVITKTENKVCDKCGTECPSSALFCKGCGNKFEKEVVKEVVKEEMMFCGNCGKQIAASALFCKYCGSKVN